MTAVTRVYLFRASAAILLGLGILRIADSQTPSPVFEVASIRENTGAGPPIWAPQRSGDRVTLRKVRLDVVIDYAFHIDNLYQVSFPANMPLEWYDIEAKSAGVPDEDRLRQMFQTLLAERCNLKTHFETREIARYDLVVSKPGKLKVADPEATAMVEKVPMRPHTAYIMFGTDTEHFAGKDASVEQIADALSRNLRALVRDMTGLTGTYDFDVAFARQDDSLNGSLTAPLQEVIQRELGLKLEKSKGPMKVLVVDHVEKPTAN